MKSVKDNGQTATAQSVTEELRQSILSGELAPGQRLGQVMLAEKLNTSRMPIRTALQELESEGLVTLVPNKGAWVASLDPDEFQDVYKLREVVEPFALQESIPHLTEAQIDELAELHTQLDEAVYPQLSAEEFLRLDRDFHLLSYAGVKHQLLAETLTRLWNTTQHFRRSLVTRQTHDQIVTTHTDHGLILDAIRRRDGESAGKLLWVHLHRTRQFIQHEGL